MKGKGASKGGDGLRVAGGVAKKSGAKRKDAGVSGERAADAAAANCSSLRPEPTASAMRQPTHP
jgi:hypothetical protein